MADFTKFSYQNHHFKQNLIFLFKTIDRNVHYMLKYSWEDVVPVAILINLLRAETTIE